MEINNKTQGFLHIIAAYIQFLFAADFNHNDQSFISGLFFFISVFLVFALSARGLIILFSDKKG